MKKYTILFLICLFMVIGCSEEIIYKGTGISKSPEQAKAEATNSLLSYIGYAYCNQTSAKSVEGLIVKKVSYHIFGSVFVAEYSIKKTDIIKVECEERSEEVKAIYKRTFGEVE